VQKSHCSLFSNSEPHIDNTQSKPSAHLLSQLENLGRLVQGRATVLVRVTDKVTKLCGKINK